ncbi:expansin-A10 [Cryptomeria japonica]|uniref:expansin-A10 n=1 Tax=Cryptomeria japonica TaxID=3369 RepID=UPI0027DAAB2E|nr:expansin-A10 [Cryptomeria japonica]
MASPKVSSFFSAFIISTCLLRTANAIPKRWFHAHATFYGDKKGSDGSFGGACGYNKYFQQDYGIANTALSTALFKGGLACGGCFRIKCNVKLDRQWCVRGNPSIIVTATNFCPPNNSLPNNNGGWCNPPLRHFDMSQPAFKYIAYYKAGIVPVLYKRVPCRRKGGIQFTITGNPYFNLILVANVGGAGEVYGVWIKGSKTSKWEKTRRNWGQHWETDNNYTGQSLSFIVMTSDRKSVASYNVAPSNWQYGQTYIGKQF